MAAWFGFGSNAKAPRLHYGGGPHELGYVGYADRLAAYEDAWRREESELWEWLEERVGMNEFEGGGDRNDAASRAAAARGRSGKRMADPRGVEQRVREEKMSGRELREAIRVTEEKLRLLESVVNRDEKE